MVKPFPKKWSLKDEKQVPTDFTVVYTLVYFSFFGVITIIIGLVAGTLRPALLHSLPFGMLSVFYHLSFKFWEKSKIGNFELGKHGTRTQKPDVK